MSISAWLRYRKRPVTRGRTQSPARRRAGFRPHLESFEDRWVPSTLIVTNTNDNGAGSLRAQIAAANSGDTIVFDSDLAGQTITLTSGELAINKSLTIEGTPGGPEAISAYYASRVLDITGAANVTLGNLLIEYGMGVEGAGIYNNGGTLTIHDGTVSGNSTHSPSFNGGGIYNNGGTVTINSSILSGNDAEFHYLAGGGNGGGIYNNGGTVTINNSTLSGNDAYYQGGGIYNNGGTVTVNNSAVVGNYVYFGGGGIYNTATGTAIVEHSSSITGNTGGDVSNLGVVYQDATSTIGVLLGNPAIPLDPNAPQLQIHDVTVAEGNAGTVAAAFTVTLSAASSQPVTVAYATGTGNATAGSDYVAKSGTLTFAPGETTKTITIAVNGDSKKEANEYFFLDLFGNSTNSLFTKSRGVGTILNDD